MSMSVIKINDEKTIMAMKVITMKMMTMKMKIMIMMTMKIMTMKMMEMELTMTRVCREVSHLASHTH